MFPRSPSLRYPFLLPLIFGLGIRLGLPLHVGGRVGSTALERRDVVDHIAWATPRRLSICRAWIRALKGILCCSASLDTPLRVPFNARTVESAVAAGVSRVIGITAGAAW